MSDKVSMIIPCLWDNQALVEITRDCVKSLHKTTKPDQVILVDDCSRIDADFLYKDEDFWKDTVSLIVRRTANGGYAHAVNSGLEKATGDYIVVSNNDIMFIQPDWLEHLLKPLKEGYDISSIRTTDVDGWTTEDRIEDNAKFGSIWAMRRKVYGTIGGLDEGFGKGYFEDLDFQKRAEDSGFRIGKNHAGVAEHIGKATFTVVDPDDSTYWKAREAFIKKWGYIE